MVVKIIGSWGKSSGDQTKTVNRLIMLALCTSFISGCTGQKLAAPLAKQSLSKDAQQAAVSEKRKPAQAQRVDPMTTASVQPKSPFEMEAEASAEEKIVMGPFPQLGEQDGPSGHLVDHTFTGSIDSRMSSQGEGRTKLERISNTVSASCRRILAEAGVTKTTFYKHFESRDDLLIAAIRRRDEWEMQAWAGPC